MLGDEDQDLVRRSFLSLQRIQIVGRSKANVVLSVLIFEDLMDAESYPGGESWQSEGEDTG